MKTRLIKYLNIINFQSKRQFYFTKEKSTEDALIGLVNRVYNSFNENYDMSVLFVDFKKVSNW